MEIFSYSRKGKLPTICPPKRVEQQMHEQKYEETSRFIYQQLQLYFKKQFPEKIKSHIQKLCEQNLDFIDKTIMNEINKDPTFQTFNVSSDFFKSVKPSFLYPNLNEKNKENQFQKNKENSFQKHKENSFQKQKEDQDPQAIIAQFIQRRFNPSFMDYNDIPTHENNPEDIKKIKGIQKYKVTSAMIRKDFTCAVCRDQFKVEEDVALLPCQHTFHQSCIYDWFPISLSCPICRFDLSNKKIENENQIENQIENQSENQIENQSENQSENQIISKKSESTLEPVLGSQHSFSKFTKPDDQTSENLDLFDFTFIESDDEN